MQTDIKPGDKVVCLKKFCPRNNIRELPVKGRYYTVASIGVANGRLGINLSEVPVPSPYRGWLLFSKRQGKKNFEKVVKSSQSVEDMIRLARPESVKLLEKL